MSEQFDFCSKDKVNIFIDECLGDIIYDDEEHLNEDRGFIYLIDFGDGKTKIGFTKRNPRNRMKQLSSSGTIMPFELKLVALGLCSEVRCIERVLHSRYKCLRTVGEWFDFSKDAGVEKLKLIEDLYFLSYKFCFCEGWENWKPKDDFIKGYSLENKIKNIEAILDWEQNKEEYIKKTSEWIDSLIKNPSIC